MSRPQGMRLSGESSSALKVRADTIQLMLLACVNAEQYAAAIGTSYKTLERALRLGDLRRGSAVQSQPPMSMEHYYRLKFAVKALAIESPYLSKKGKTEGRVPDRTVGAPREVVVEAMAGEERVSLLGWSQEYAARAPLTRSLSAVDVINTYFWNTAGNASLVTRALTKSKAQDYAGKRGYRPKEHDVRAALAAYCERMKARFLQRAPSRIGRASVERRIQDYMSRPHEEQGTPPHPRFLRMEDRARAIQKERLERLLTQYQPIVLARRNLESGDRLRSRAALSVGEEALLWEIFRKPLDA